MTTSMITERAVALSGTRPGPPVGRAFVAFTSALFGLAVLAAVELTGSFNLPIGSSAQFGVAATTTFATAGLLALYRAVAIRNLWAAAAAAVLMGPGAAWSWATFVGINTSSPMGSSLVVATAGVLSIVLLVKGLRLARWLEVFGGLGSCGLTLVAATIHFEPMASTSAATALVAAVSGMICLYGLLVDLELAEHRSFVELVESRKRIEQEVSQVEELLHDLQGGLLAIEAAIGSFDSELAGPLSCEAARLRRLTRTGARTVADFDLAERVRNLVAARQAGGMDISLRAPDQAVTWGEESEVLAIVDNLLSNAQRHGTDGSAEVEIKLEVSEGRELTKLLITNPGELPPGDVFQRGVTTHPDGNGIGLARARVLAEINGAELRVSPSSATHTTFVLTLGSSPQIRCSRQTSPAGHSSAAVA